jgi:hypothetical protein
MTTESGTVSDVLATFQIEAARPYKRAKEVQAKQEETESGCKSTPPSHAWHFHLALFKLADKIVLDGLAKIASKRLAWCCAETAQDAESFIILLTELWSMHQNGLDEAKSSALTAASLNASTLSNTSSFDSLIKTFPEFGTDLIRKMAEKTNSSDAPASQPATIPFSNPIRGSRPTYDWMFPRRGLQPLDSISDSLFPSPASQLSQVTVIDPFVQPAPRPPRSSFNNPYQFLPQTPQPFLPPSNSSNANQALEPVSSSVPSPNTSSASLALSTRTGTAGTANQPPTQLNTARVGRATEGPTLLGGSWRPGQSSLSHTQNAD